MNYDILIFNIAIFVATIFLLDYEANKFIDYTTIVALRLDVFQTFVTLLIANAKWKEICEPIYYYFVNYSLYSSLR